jgi:hypothetical protein
MEEQAESKVQTEYTQHDIREIRMNVDELKKTLNEVHSALVGNDLAKDGGLVQRIVNSEQEVLKLSDRLTEVEKQNTKAGVYLRIIWGLSGCVASAILIAIINHLTK